MSDNTEDWHVHAEAALREEVKKLRAENKKLLDELRERSATDVLASVIEALTANIHRLQLRIRSLEDEKYGWPSTATVKNPPAPIERVRDKIIALEDAGIINNDTLY